jgi:hypothetical protein
MPCRSSAPPPRRPGAWATAGGRGTSSARRRPARAQCPGRASAWPSRGRSRRRAWPSATGHSSSGPACSGRSSPPPSPGRSRLGAATGDEALVREAEEQAPGDEEVAAARAELHALLDQPDRALAAVAPFIAPGLVPGEPALRALEAAADAASRAATRLDLPAAPIAQARLAAAAAERGDPAAARAALEGLRSLPRRDRTDAAARAELVELAVGALRAGTALHAAELTDLGRLALEAHRLALLVEEIGDPRPAAAARAAPPAPGGPSPAQEALLEGLPSRPAAQAEEAIASLRAAQAEPELGSRIHAAREACCDLMMAHEGILLDVFKSLLLRPERLAAEVARRAPKVDAMLARHLLLERPWEDRAVLHLVRGEAAEAVSAARRPAGVQAGPEGRAEESARPRRGPGGGGARPPLAPRGRPRRRGPRADPPGRPRDRARAPRGRARGVRAGAGALVRACSASRRSTTAGPCSSRGFEAR